MIYLLVALLGLLPVLPILIKGSPVLNKDMLVAYFCYFWDFHRNWSWSHPMVFWSSSYQCGMPMHAYWQSGFLYPITWLLFGPLSPLYGIYLFYAFHFSLGILGFLRLGPRLHLGRAASLWAGICFSLSGTMLARYEHATFLAGWAWLPLVLSAFLSLRGDPRPKTLFWYASAVCLQALGGHPQASAATAILIAAFTVTSLIRIPRRRAAWVLGGHVLALVYCAPLVVPFLQLVDQTDRFGGTAWESDLPGTAAPSLNGDQNEEQNASAARKLKAGVFGYKEFSTGGMRPAHLLSLIAPHALGSPSNASWWGGEVWGEVFVYLGGLGLFFCFFASPKRAGRDLRWLWAVGLAGLWISFGSHLGASQILYHVPVFNNFRRPARFLILFVFAMAALSAHGLQRWLGHPKGQKPAGGLALVTLFLAFAVGLLRFFPDMTHALIGLAQMVKTLDPAKDYAGKIAALLGRGAMDLGFLSLASAALWFHARRHALAASPGTRSKPERLRLHRSGTGLLFLILVLDLLRVHWDHFYLFPSDYYRRPPESIRVLDQATEPFWRVSHYLEYPGLEMWEMHNDPLAHFDLLDREKTALSCGIHAVFNYKHVSAHLPLLWKWEPGQTPASKATRYLFSNVSLSVYKGDSLDLVGRFGTVNAYELKDWRPRLETVSRQRNAGPTVCAAGFSGYGGLCVREARDGDFQVRSDFRPGDTLIVRERFNPEWKYRSDGGAWQRPLETPEHFIAMPLTGAVKSIDLIYSPREFYRLAGFAILVTAALLGFLRFRKKP